MIKNAKFNASWNAKGILTIKESVKREDSAKVSHITEIPDKFDFSGADEKAVEMTIKALINRFESFLKREFIEDAVELDNDEYSNIKDEF